MRTTRSRFTHGRALALLLSAFFINSGVLQAAQPGARQPGDDAARAILDATGVKGGLVVHLGCVDGALTAALCRGESYLVHGLDVDPDNVAKARKQIRAKGLYGQVSVDRLIGKRLPYTDNLVNLIVAEKPGAVPRQEMMRVLAPGGVAYVRTGDGWTKQVKPRPAGIDQWTHFLHGPNNNAVAEDRVVGPPHHLQWVGGPKWARSHDHLASVSALVSAGGRIFYIVDEGPIAAVVLPSHWTLVARDAFSGVVLWKRPIPAWEWHLRGFRSGPSDLARRLVAIGDTVYVTLGYGEPLCALDAATGKTLKTYKGTDGALEVVCSDGTLYVVVGDPEAESAAAEVRRRGPLPAPSQIKSQRPAYTESSPRKHLVAIDAKTGAQVWKRADEDTSELMPTTLAVSGGRAFFQDADEVICLDAKTGDEKWRADRPTARNRPTWSAPTLVVAGKVVLSGDRAAPAAANEDSQSERTVEWMVSSAGGQAPVGDLIAYSADTGERLWSSRCRECYNAPVDVLVTGELVWTGNLVSARDPGITEARDLKTGEVVKRRPADSEFFAIGMSHHRCYRNKATTEYLVLGRSGVEFLDVDTGDILANHWTRGTCQLGVMPCNGLLYAPSHSCACFITAKLNGFNCLAPKREERGDGLDADEPASRLERGPAYASGFRVQDPGFSQRAVRGSHDPALIDDRRSPAEQARRPPVEAAARSGDPRRAQVDPRRVQVDPRRAQDRDSRARQATVHPSSFIPHPSEAWPTYRHDPARSGQTSSKVPAELRPAWQADLGGRLSSVVVAKGKVFVAQVDEHTVHALDSDDGKRLWSYTAGGRVDSPPTIDQGRVLFGSADGWLYCLSAEEGALAWRFRAAPEDRRVVAYGQLESAWPVHGSVLMQDGLVYCTAGRSSYLDGGIYLCRLDTKTGKLLSQTCLNSRDPETGRQPKGVVRGTNMPGALSDVLSSDGTSVYMRHRRFDLQGVPQPSDVAHLFSSVGFLDDSWWHRTYWLIGTSVGCGYGGWPHAGNQAPAGRLLAVSDDSVYGFGRSQYIHHGAHVGIDGATVFHFRPDREDDRRFTHYRLFAAATDSNDGDERQPAAKKPAANRRAQPKSPAGKYRWTTQIPVLARAMVLADETLFVAGPPDIFHSDDPTGALEGNRGGLLLAVSTADGQTVAKCPLDSPPVFDGMAAADGRLYLATLDGHVIAMAGK